MFIYFIRSIILAKFIYNYDQTPLLSYLQRYINSTKKASNSINIYCKFKNALNICGLYSFVS